jgi:hypothetical protein
LRDIKACSVVTFIFPFSCLVRSGGQEFPQQPVLSVLRPAAAAVWRVFRSADGKTLSAELKILMAFRSLQP